MPLAAPITPKSALNNGTIRGSRMENNIAEVVDEVIDAFLRYEEALGTNDIGKLFWENTLTLRYGPNGTLDTQQFRDSDERAESTVVSITTFGRDFAVVNTESERPESDPGPSAKSNLGTLHRRQRIVSAHVSDVPPSTQRL
jgi:Protein of unknown function (DUF3225)